MPALILRMLISMGAGTLAERAGSAMLRKLFSTGGKSLSKAAASGAAELAAKNVAGRAVDAKLAQALSGAPEWLASRANVGNMARNLTEFGSTMGKFGLMSGGMMAADYLMPGLGSNIDHDKSVEGWEMFQGQMQPGQAQQMGALTAVEQDAQMKHLQRALNEYVAYQRESGGLI